MGRDQVAELDLMDKEFCMLALGLLSCIQLQYRDEGQD